MKIAIVAALTCAALVASASAQVAVATAADTLQARTDQLRSKVDAARAEITRISRDPAMPEEQRSARIDAIVAEINAENEAIAKQADAMSAAQAQAAAASPRSSGAR